ncbi:MAG: hypothetical protein E6R13_06230 [Spirochaetes bacterium]|nr:MAG: hypothetical protein E6R13_06230 [Spirochaetota bacterium]
MSETIKITDTRIKELVSQGLRHKEIANQLSSDAGVNITTTWVKTAMKSLNLRLKRTQVQNVVLVMSEVEIPFEQIQLDQPQSDSLSDKL